MSENDLAAEIARAIAQILAGHPDQASYANGALVIQGDQAAFDAAIGRLTEIGTPDQVPLFGGSDPSVCFHWPTDTDEEPMELPVAFYPSPPPAPRRWDPQLHAHWGYGPDGEPDGIRVSFDTSPPRGPAPGIHHRPTTVPPISIWVDPDR
jgi:hypothetical protein